ncbi:toll/interleukin-1 receptor domain-containing protein [Algivirga pacifica]|uniref:TIR domain-containing protein n=1 Tax=Algivirga pacifica TaxID=1162670 RepID=A0ABP9DEA9_9BACT
MVGQERMEAEKWLLHKFDAITVPCVPSELHTFYLAESRKNGENLYTDAFISYSRKVSSKMQEVRAFLHRHLVTTWIDQEDIPKGESYNDEVQKGIEQADTFVFLISPETIASEACQKELRYAFLLQKKVIPVMVKNTPDEELPKPIRDLQYIDWKMQKESLPIELLEDKDYLNQHKHILIQALKWEKLNHNNAILLRGHALDRALDWLEGAKDRKKNKPTKIQRDFILESDQKRNELDYEVFISYSRKDSRFVRQLNNDLEERGKTTWFDQENIPTGAKDFWEEIKKGIAASMNYLFVISPDSINSEYCVQEVEYAASLGKRIITINYEDADIEQFPKQLKSINWIDFSNVDNYISAFGQLIRELDTDRDYVSMHSYWDRKAREWEEATRNPALLLRGVIGREAWNWMVEASKAEKRPRVTKLQREFIQASHRESRKNRRLRFAAIGNVVFMVLAVIFAVYAFAQVVELEEEKELVLIEKEKAEQAEQRAEEARLRALQAKYTSDSLRLVAESHAMLAERQKEEADRQRAYALRKSQQADSLRLIAMQSAERATFNEQTAKGALKKAQQVTEEIQKYRQLSVAQNMMLRAPDMEDQHVRSSLARQAYVAYQLLGGKGSDSDAYRSLRSALKIQEVPLSENMAELKHPVQAMVLGKGEEVFVASEDERLYRLNENKETLLKDKNVTSLAYDPFQDKLFIATREGDIYTVKGNDKPERILSKFKESIISIAQENEQSLLLLSAEGILYRFDLAGREWSIIDIHAKGEKVTDLAVSPNGTWAYCTQEGTVEVISPDSTSQWVKVKHRLWNIALPPHANEVTFASVEGRMYQGMLGRKKMLIKPFSKGHLSMISDLRYSDSGEYLASAGYDRTVRIWKADEPKERAIEIDDFDNWIHQVAFSPDEERVFIGTNSGAVNVVEVRLDRLFYKLNEVSSDTLTEQEWEEYVGSEYSEMFRAGAVEGSQEKDPDEVNLQTGL